MQGDLYVTARIEIPADELSFSFVRSSGPGGQNVNKVNTKAVLRWNVAQSGALPKAVGERFLSKYSRRINADGELLLTSQRYRDQHRNVDDCLDKLRAMIISVAAAPTPRKATRPSRAARERRLTEKRKASQRKSARSKKPSLDD